MDAMRKATVAFAEACAREAQAYASVVTETSMQLQEAAQALAANLEMNNLEGLVNAAMEAEEIMAEGLPSSLRLRRMCEGLERMLRRLEALEQQGGAGE